MSNMSKDQKWANMSAGLPSNAQRLADSDSCSSNGKKTPQEKRSTREPNKKQKTGYAKDDQGGQNVSQARVRHRDQKVDKELHAKNTGTVTEPDSGRNEDMNNRDTQHPNDDVMNGNADGRTSEETDMEVDDGAPEPPAGSGATGNKTPGSGGPEGETPADSGDGRIQNMDTGLGTENPEDNPKGISDTKDTDGDGDVHDGGQHVSEDQAPETPSAPDEAPPAKIKGIKEKAASRREKQETIKSTKDKQKPNSRDGGDKPEEPKPHRSPPEYGQQPPDALDTNRKKSQPKSHGLFNDDPQQTEEWGFQARYPHPGPGHGDRMSAQKKIQTQRSLQASKQMAYQVFANVLTAIEEQENRESKNYQLKKPEKSAAFIPDQSWKKDDDVLAGVEAQLTVFQAHMGFCPKEVAEAAKVEMIDTTLYWAAARQEIGLPTTPTDRYAINLLEILYDGATSNTFQMLKESRKTFGRSELMENVGKIMAGQAKADQLDKQFRDDPRKEAKALPIRQGQSISNGLERLLNIAYTEGMKKSIRYHLEDHLETVSAR